MINILSDEGRKALESLCSSRCLLAFDFDGTLSALASSPGTARLDPSIARLVEELEKLTPIAVISGRKKSDVERFFLHPPRLIVGNHGAEGVEQESFLQAAADMCAQWYAYLVPFLQQNDDSGKAWIENKVYSLTIHCHSPAALKKLEHLVPLASDTLPFMRFLPGKATINITPEGSANKGTAMLTLIQQTETEKALFIGDDTTDEDVFRLHDERILTIHVGESSESDATFFLAHQSSIYTLLNEILEMLMQQQENK